MQEEKPDNNKREEDIIDLAMKKVQSIEEDIVADEEVNNDTDQEDELIDNDQQEDDLADRRKYPRSEFTYPVEFRLFSRSSDNPAVRGSDNTSYNGYLKDISLSGARLQFEDKYGRFDMKGMNGKRLKISFSVLDGDKVNIFALIRWIKRADPKSFHVKIGIEFIDMESWQLDVIEKLIVMKNKDHNMMWNLWEQYETNWK